MIIAMNAPVPEYRATVKLVPVEEKPMKIINKYKKPLVNRENAVWILVYWAVICLVAVIV